MGKLAAPVRADKDMMFTNHQLVALMWPLLLEQFLAITVGLADSLMVATVGDAAISAVSLVDSISNLMIYIFSAMATGGAKRSACLAQIFFRMFICVRLLLILPSRASISDRGRRRMPATRASSSSRCSARCRSSSWRCCTCSARRY